MNVPGAAMRTVDRLCRLLFVFLGTFPCCSQLAGEVSYRYLSEGTLRITSILLEPYLMENPEHVHIPELPRYVGFIPDLLEEISEITRFQYTIVKAPGNSFGYRTNEGSWDGMIGQLARGEAEIAAGPMYKTSQRGKAVDFTVPFLNVHATLLLRKPPPGSDLHIRSIEDLINQSEIQYGTLDRGVIIRAFKTTNVTAERYMWRNIMRFGSSALTETNEEGISKVRSEKYAFVIPHTIGEYMALQPPCDLLTLGRFLMNRGYSFAVGRNSPLLHQLNTAILTLEDNGKILEIYRKWWSGQSQCESATLSASRVQIAAQSSATRAPPSGSLTVLLVGVLTLFMVTRFL